MYIIFKIVKNILMSYINVHCKGIGDLSIKILTDFLHMNYLLFDTLT